MTDRNFKKRLQLVQLMTLKELMMAIIKMEIIKKKWRC